MIDDQLIEHEIQLRVLKERTDEQTINISGRFDKLEAKIDSNFNNLLIMFIASVLLPVALHAMKLI